MAVSSIGDADKLYVEETDAVIINMTDAERMVTRAREAFYSGKTRSVEFRKQQLRNLMKMYDEHQEEFVEVMYQDLRKPRQEVISFEIEYNRNDIRETLNNIDDWVKDTYVEKNLVTLLDTTYIHNDPYGVVLVLGAWNYPVQLSLCPMAGAIAAGNCVVVKPSELSPKTSALIAKLIPKYLDSDCFHVFEGGIPETTDLLKQRFDYIFFTGSSKIGKIVGEAANKHLTPCTMELGGKCPVYIDEQNVHLYTAIKRILWGKLINLGQTCVAPDYILCSNSAKQRIIDMIKRVAEEIYGEDRQKCPDIGRIVNERNFDRLAALLDKTKGNVVYGGKRDRDDLFIDLTVITDFDDVGSEAVMSEELFGPIFPIITVNNAYEAIEFINARDKPLSMYIFSESKSTRELFISNTSAGSVCCNDVIVQLSVSTLPFGGVGLSGYGSYHGKYTYKTMSHAKSIVVRDFSFLGEKLGAFRYPPYSQKKIDEIKLLLKARKIPSVFGYFKYMACIGVGVAIALSYKVIAKKLGYESDMA